MRPRSTCRRPHGVLPFTIDEARARDLVRSELGEASELRRVFLPAMIISTEARVHYGGWIIDPETDERSYREDHALRPFDHRMILGTTEAAAQFCPPAWEWPLGLVEPFDPRWLLGSTCEHTDVDAEGAFARLRPELEDELETEVRNDFDGELEQLDLRLDDVRYRYVLLPAWVGSYENRGELAHLLVHGRTGAVFSPRSVQRARRRSVLDQLRGEWRNIGMSVTVRLVMLLPLALYPPSCGGLRNSREPEPEPKSEPVAAKGDIRAVVAPIRGVVTAQDRSADTSGLKVAWIDAESPR